MYIIKGIYFPRKIFTERGNIMLKEKYKEMVLNLVKLKVEEDKYHICEKYGIRNDCDVLQYICEQNLSTILKSVSKPGRYTGGEYGQIIKDKKSVIFRIN